MQNPKRKRLMPEWQETIETAINSIVSIRFSHVFPFDTEENSNSEATGFVVDHEQGIILTNRHVVGSGPFVGEAIWHNHEEVNVFPVYRDPIHDYGFLRFNPKDLKYLQVEAIELMPESVNVGLDIRVVGNDAGERMSILSGSISRLNRNAPDYGEMNYNDFNTFYLQAAASTSGGSSGSPVLNIHGQAVALQAGGSTQAATDFFLPLDRVKRALKLLQQNKLITRGTIQTKFCHRPFDEAKRIGLRPETEEYIRRHCPKEIGMLCVDNVLGNGPADGMLEEGDILISINDMIITSFVDLEELLDSNVSANLTFKVERGGKELIYDITVQDLHSITPDRYIDVGGATFNNLSYQLAMQYTLPVQGVYCCKSGGCFRFKDRSASNGYIITDLDSIPTPDLETFMDILQKIPDRAKIPIKYYEISDVHSKYVEVINLDLHWKPFRLAIRNDHTGFWDFTILNKTPSIKQTPMSVQFPELDLALGPTRYILQSIAIVTMTLPIKIEGYPNTWKKSAGLVVDAEKGWVIVSRNTVPYDFGDIFLTFAESIEIPGKVVFLHPTHNITLISYDPTLLGNTPVKSAPLSEKSVVQGISTVLFGFNLVGRPVCITTTVTDVGPVSIPCNLNPRFRAINFQGIHLDTPLAQQCSSGVLTDHQGKVQAIWLSFLGDSKQNGGDNEYYIGYDFREFLNNFRENIQSPLRGLSAEFETVPISLLRNMGVTEEWVKRIEAKPQKKLFMVKRVEAGSPTASALQDLDVVLQIKNEIVTNISKLQVSRGWPLKVPVTLVRNKQIIDMDIPTSLMDHKTKHIVLWAGAVITEPHYSVLLQSSSKISNIYVANRSKGSPAYTYGLFPTLWIIAVNGVAVNTLDDFCREIRHLKNQFVRIKTISFDSVPYLLSIKNTDHYWPLEELVHDGTEWQTRSQ